MSAPAHARGALVLALRSAGIRDLAVLRAVELIPREAFLPHALRDLGARNIAVPIACGQTMPPPLALATMLEALGIQAKHRVLEIGTGSGYATAVLARLAGEVVSVERYKTLAIEAEGRLRALGIAAQIVVGDGLAHPDEFGLFDRIVVHLALPAIPRQLERALAPDGRIAAGVSGDKDGPAGIAIYEHGGESFASRWIAPFRMSAPEAGLPKIL